MRALPISLPPWRSYLFYLEKEIKYENKCVCVWLDELSQVAGHSTTLFFPNNIRMYKYKS